MTIEELARKYANTIPNSKLVKYYEAAIPQYCIDTVLIMEKEKPLSVLQEFILKFTAEGIDNIREICGFLGVNMTAVSTAVAEMQKVNLIVVDINDMRIKLTEKGRESLRAVKTITPEEVEYQICMDSFTGNIYIDSLNKYNKKDVKRFELVAVPPFIETPTLSNLKFEDVKVAIDKFRRNNYYSKDKLEGNLLDIAELDKVYTEYNKVYVLVFLNNKTGDIELRVFEKQTRRQEYENILLQMYNKHTRIFELDQKEDIDDVKENSFYDILSDDIKNDAASYTNRAVEIDKEIEQLKSQLSEITNQSEGAEDENTRFQIHEIQQQIDEREDEREGATKILSTYDHRPLLIKALNEAHNSVIIVSPWIKRGGLNNEILSLIRSAVNRGINITIGYGISQKKDSDKWVLEELNKIAKNKNKGKLQIVALNNTHEKVLIMDNKFLVITSFNWLSFGGDPKRGFRQETGIYTESIESILDMKADLSKRMDISL